MMSHRRSSPVIALTLLLALVAAPKSLAASFKADPILAQASASPAFRLPESVANDTIVKIDGSTSLETINQLLKQRFQQRYNGTKVEDSYSGTDSALQSVLDGKADLAAIGRPLTDAEKAKGFTAVPIARHKIAILVSPDNPYTGNISYEQFAKIFRGEITDWSELGGSPGAIRFIDRPDSSDTRLAFSSYPVFKASPFQAGANAVKAEDTTDAIIKQLGTDGISFAIADQVLDRQDVRIVPMHKTLPTDPRYPFSQPLAYVYKGNASPAVLAFLGFATDASNQQAIEQARASEAIAVASPLVTPPVLASPSVAAPDVSPSVLPSASPAVVATPDSGGNWLPWLLLPLLGGVGALLWALRGRQGPDLRVEDARVAPPRVPPVDMAPTRLAPPLAPPVDAVGAVGAVGAIAAVAAVGATRQNSRIILTPRNSEQAYAYWETPEAHKAELRHQGGEALKLRIYDVTDIDLETQAPHSVLQYDCSETDQDRHVPIPESDRDYLAEIGYVTSDQRWLMLARSAPVRVVADQVIPDRVLPEIEAKSTNGLGLGAIAGGAALAATALSALTLESAIPLAEPETPLAEPEISALIPPPIPPSRIVLTPRSFDDAYAYWEAPEAAKAALREQGGERLTLLLADVTGLDLNTQIPYNVQRFSCAETETDRHLPIPVGDRDYIAEIGYLTADSQWLLLARSEPIRVPPIPLVESVEAIDALLVESEPVASESAIVTAKGEISAAQPVLGGIAGAAALEVGYAFLTMPPYGEGDRPTAKPDLISPDRKGEDLGEELASVDDGLPDLPTGYDESRITLMARDPHWAYAYWDIVAERQEELRQIGGSSFALRFYDVTDVSLDTQNPHSLQQYYCNEAARDWYIPVPVSDRDYIVEIGYVTSEGTWLMLARSIPVRIPPVYPSDWYEEKFTTVPWEEEIRTRVFQELGEPYKWSGSENPAYDRIFRLAEIAQEQRISGSLLGSMQQAMGSVLPTASGMSGAMSGAMSGVGIMSGIGISGISGMGMSGIGISGVRISDIGMSGIGIGVVPTLLSMSGIGMYTTSGIEMSEISGIGMYTTSGIGVSGMSGIGYTLSGVGISGMSGISMYTLSGVGLYTTSGIGLAGMSGIGMYTLSGIGLGISGIGMYTLSGIGMSGISGIGYAMSGVGMSGVGYTMSGVGMSGVGMSGVGMSGVGMSGVGMSGVGMSGVGYTMSGVGMSGVGYTMSGVGMSGASGIGIMPSNGFINTSGIGNLSGSGLATVSGIGMYGLSGIGMYGLSGMGISSSIPSHQPRKFWLVADAELIVHGATEPNATVTIAGQIIRLSPDGTFRFQVMFPDGNFDYPVLAVAADGEQSRSLHMKFSRETPVRHVNTKDEAVNEGKA